MRRLQAWWALMVIPSGLMAAVVDAPRVLLSWQDNATNELGHRVERSTNGSAGAPTWLNLAQTGVAPGSGTRQEWEDLLVARGTRYWYRVWAFNGGGDSASPSNVVVVPVPEVAQRPDGSPSGLEAVTRGRLVNVSARALVSPDVDASVQPGFVITGGPVGVLVRAIGTDGLTGFGVPGTLEDPRLEVRNQAGALVAGNDNWSGGAVSEAAAATGAFALAEGSRDAALVLTLPAGQYTVVVRGAGTGVVLVEAYEVP